MGRSFCSYQLTHLTLHPAGQTCFLQQSRQMHEAECPPKTNEECKSDPESLFSSLNKNILCLCQLHKLYFPRRTAASPCEYKHSHMHIINVV